MMRQVHAIREHTAYMRLLTLYALTLPPSRLNIYRVN